MVGAILPAGSCQAPSGATPGLLCVESGLLFHILTLTPAQRSGGKSHTAASLYIRDARGLDAAWKVWSHLRPLLVLPSRTQALLWPEWSCDGQERPGERVLGQSTSMLGADAGV